MDEDEYATEVAYQRLRALAEVQTMLMQLRIDVLYRGPGRPQVLLLRDKLRAEGVAVWRVAAEGSSLPMWEAARLVQPLVDSFPLEQVDPTGAR
jgi:hypothetical protein